MKTLLILRHAKSSWSDSSVPDHNRPLNKRGKRDAPRMGLLIKEVGLVPQRILCSTAKRARKTARKVARYCEYDGTIELLDSLYLAPMETYFRLLAQLDDQVDRVMVVGHNPGLERLLNRLTGLQESLPTAALAQVSLPIESWQELTPDTRGTLVQLWRPRELPPL